MSQSSKLWDCDIWKCHKMSQIATFFQIYKATFTFYVWIRLWTALGDPISIEVGLVVSTRVQRHLRLIEAPFRNLGAMQLRIQNTQQFARNLTNTMMLSFCTGFLFERNKHKLPAVQLSSSKILVTHAPDALLTRISFRLWASPFHEYLVELWFLLYARGLPPLLG